VNEVTGVTGVEDVDCWHHLLRGSNNFSRGDGIAGQLLAYDKCDLRLGSGLDEVTGL